MKNKTRFVFAGISVLLFAALILCVRFVDVAAIGPSGTSIGLSGINYAVHQFFGVNLKLYDLTDYLGYLAIFVAFIFALIGFAQLLKRRGLLKIDKEILALGILYIAVIALYVLFEIVIVNYRPIIMPDATEVEASFPSSHTMLVCTIMGSAIIVLNKYANRPWLRVVLKVAFALVIVATVAGRLISGVHWFTDIIGGLLISSALLFLFSAAVKE